MNIESILCPIDDSSSSKNALIFAQNFAKDHNANVEVVHILSSDTKASNSDRENRAHQLEQRFGPDLPITYLRGKVSDIVSAISENHDLLVMGLRGANHTTNHYGSNAAQIIQTSECPVLLIPDKEVDINFRKIAFATDFKDLSKDDRFELLRDLANEHDSDLHLLHIAAETTLDEDEAEEAIELHDVFEDISHAFFMVEETDIVKGIHSHLKSNKPDLLAIMPRKTTKLASTLSQAIIESVKDVPIFSFHA